MNRPAYAELVRVWRSARLGVLKRIGESAGYPLYCWRHRGGSRHGYISAGIHGDEPAGPLAVTLLLRTLPRWFTAHSWTVFPCLNPWGYERDSRRDQDGLDLNRLWRKGRAAEVRLAKSICARKWYDMAYLMHEDYDADGFYLYELSPEEPSVGDRVLRAAGRVLPIESRRAVEGRRTHRRGLIFRGAGFKPERRQFWPEALYLIRRHTGHLFTAETPSMAHPLRVRVRAQVQSLQAAVQALLMPRPERRPAGS